MPKTFNRKCGYCDRLFNHWSLAYNHEKKCRIRTEQSEAKEKRSAWQKPGFHGPELTLDEAFKGFRDGD